MRLQDIVAIGGARTPLGKYGGVFRDIPNYKLGAHAIEGALQRANIPPALVQNVILGCCRQAGSGVNPARTAALLAGLPQKTPSVTVNMACASGMLAVIQVVQAMLVEDCSLAVAGGMDSMSSMPHLIRNYRWQTDRNCPQKIEDSWTDAIDPLIGKTLGFVAEKLADKYGLTRDDLDRYALESHQKSLRYSSARADEIVPIEFVSTDSQTQTVIGDECPRADTSLEKLATLSPAFKEDGLLTAGNSCCMADGAVALIFTTRERASELGVRPLFSILSCASIGCAPEWFGEGPALALRHALEKANLEFKQLDCLEINEGFATQALANEKMLRWDRTKVNVHGGAIALGHPSGMSGARIILSLYHVLRTQGKEIGGAAITGAGGVATALIIQRES